MSGFTSGCGPAKKATSERISVLNPYTMSLNRAEEERKPGAIKKKKKRRISQWYFTWVLGHMKLTFDINKPKIF
jgi:hypothetical protein